MGYQFNDSLGNLTGQATKAIGKKLQQYLDAEKAGIKVDQWVILVLLWEKDGRRQQDLADFSRKDKVMVTRLIDQLEDKELVNRVQDKYDKRNRLIYLTPKARELKASLLEPADAALNDAIQGIEEKDLETTRAVLRKIISNLS